MKAPLKVLGLAVLTLLAAAGCSSDSGTTTTTPSTPTGPFTDVFTSIIYPQDVLTHSFAMSTSGTITVTLTSAGPPSSVVMGLGLGVPRPDAPGCSLLTALSTPAGAAPQITTTADNGTYCVALFDVGNAIVQGESFSITVVHP